MKTIRVVIVGSAVAVGRRCAPFHGGADPGRMERLFRGRNETWWWEPRKERWPDVAIVECDLDTLEPTDDGDPDELALCEQAQRGDRPIFFGSPRMVAP